MKIDIAPETQESRGFSHHGTHGKFKKIFVQF